VNPEEVRRILLACRPDAIDPADPDVRAALELVERDPALAGWWREQKKFYATVRSAFQSLPVPEGLREAILAEPKTIRVNWWRTTPIRAAAIAASLLALLSILVWRPSESAASFDRFRDRMVRTVIREYRMDIRATTDTDIRAFLRENKGYSAYRLRGDLSTVPLFGAGRLSWNGQPVSMICFERRQKVLMYLFVIDRTAFPSAGDTVPGPSPTFAEVVERATASWVDGKQVYVLVSEAGMNDLQSLVK
jgi:hypothetical protein